MPRPYQGFRIVKPRTENQLLAADAWGRCQPDSVTAILPRDLGLPVDSWWTQPGDFAALARREQKRMELSKFGRTMGDHVL